MIKAKSSQLKAKLGQYLRAVRAGKTVLVHDRETPVARLVPLSRDDEHAEQLISRPKDPTAPPPGSVKVKAIPFRGTDSTAMLREDRDRR